MRQLRRICTSESAALMRKSMSSNATMGISLESLNALNAILSVDQALEKAVVRAFKKLRAAGAALALSRA